jgi:lysophospholipase L1-like esterase
MISRMNFTNRLDFTRIVATLVAAACSYWNPAGSGGTWWNHWAMDSISALDSLAAQGHEVNLRGFFWLQGESDSDTQTASSAYESNFVAFTDNVYSHLQAEGYDPTGMAFVTALIRDYQTYTPTVRDAQKSVMDDLPNGSWFDTNDLQTFDGLHYNATGVNVIGQRFAAQMASVPEPSVIGCWAGGTLIFGAVAIRNRWSRSTKPVTTSSRNSSRDAALRLGLSNLRRIVPIDGSVPRVPWRHSGRSKAGC